MKEMKKYQFWFCTGSQDLYGEECLKKVAAHSREMVEGLNAGVHVDRVIRNLFIILGM